MLILSNIKKRSDILIWSLKTNILILVSDNDVDFNFKPIRDKYL
jgi:hypothetical protein